MSRLLLLLTLAASTLPFSVMQAEEPQAALVDGYFNAMNAEQATYDAMRKKLQTPVSCDFTEVPLTEAAKYLAEKAGGEIRVDQRSIREADISPFELVTLSAENIPLQSLLHLLCRFIDDGRQLAFAIEGDRIKLTSQDRIDKQQRVIYYPCVDLLYDQQGEGPEYSDLIYAITQCIDCESWEELGGSGVVQPLSNGLLVSQSDSNHEQIAALFAAIRQAKGLSIEKYDPSPISVGFDEAKRAKLEKSLLTPLADFELNITSLVDAIRALSEHCNVPMVINANALDEIGVELDKPLTDRWKAATAETILRDILDSLELAYVVHDDLIEITTPERQERDLETKLYPLRDWLAAESEADLLNEHSCRLDPSTFDGVSRQLLKYDPLDEAIGMNVDPDSWEELGGPGVRRPVWAADAIAVTQTREIHARLERLLATLRRDRQPMPEIDKTTPPKPPLVVAYELGEQDGAEVFVKTLREEIEPDSWDGRNHYVRVAGSKLLIKQTPETHQKIRRWIALLLGPKPPFDFHQPVGGAGIF